MKYLEKDTQVKELESRISLKKYLEFRKNNDQWSFPFIFECAVVGIDNAPLFFPDFKKNVGVFYPDADGVNENAATGTLFRDGIAGKMLNVPAGVSCTDEDLTECAEDTGLFLCLPVDGEMQIFPTRYTAFSSICDRAGISGQTICNNKPKAHTKMLPVTEKAAWLTRGFSLRDANAKALIRDGKISCMMSSEYEILPADELIMSLEAYLAKEYPSYRYVMGRVSHEFLVCEYYLGDSDIENEVKQVFRKFGYTVDNVKAYIRFSTSDIGLSKVYVKPFFEIDDFKCELGRGVELRHDSGNTVDDFSVALNELNSFFKLSVKQVLELGNTEIKNVAGCIQHMCIEKKFIPKAYADKKIRKLADEFLGKTGSAIDVYLAVCEILETYAKNTNISPTQYIKLHEEVSRLLYIDFKRYDYIYVPEN